MKSQEGLNKDESGRINREDIFHFTNQWNYERFAQVSIKEPLPFFKSLHLA